MYTPIIPSVTTSVIDRSTIDVVLNGFRTVLIPGFFKYGREGFTRHDSVDKLRYSLGREDVKKYGKAYLYAEAAAITDNVITYRLLPADATYANKAIRLTGIEIPDSKFYSYEHIHSKADMTYYNGLVDAQGNEANKVDPDIVISALASARGEGYNSIFVKFAPAISHEKADSNVSGETNYKFNFLQAEIYEETPTGIKSLGDPVVFSLMDVDPITNQPITDIVTGNALYVNDAFKESNEFATLMINEKYQIDLRAGANIDALTDNRLIVEDPDVAGKYYEIKVETYDKIVPDPITGVNLRVPTERLTTVITNTIPTVAHHVLKYTNAAGEVKAKEIFVKANVISFVDSTLTSVDNLAIDGEEAFYNLALDTNGDATIIDIVNLRHQVYTKLLDFSLDLGLGVDGESLHRNGKLNMIGTPVATSQNGKELLLDFYNNTEDLREVLYPKYDFDYIPDWSENADVQVAIINLADDIGLSMPLLSLPLSYDPTTITRELPDKDLKTRKEKVFQSSYNSMMYSGQMNKTHKTSRNIKMYMPLSYYAMIAHLRIDNQFSITEPVANLVKGTLASTTLNLTYAPTSLEIEKLRNQQVNTVIVEPDGTYIIDQLTMYKKASKLSRGNIVKVLHRMRKDLPKLLKDLLQNKAIGSITDTAVARTENELAKWTVTPENEKNGIFESVDVKASFNDATYKLRLTITVKPVGTLESIDIPIIVV